MSRVSRWREVRDSQYLDRWNEYYRLWRGVWTSADKTRNSERSRIIAPALAEAIDLTHAELTDAIFGRTRWITVDDDVTDQEKADVESNLETLLEDLEDEGVPDSIIKAIQVGCVYGTGAVKIGTDVKKIKEIGEKPDGTRGVIEKDYACVKVYPLDPREVVPDPAAEHVEDMLGIAHETFVPIHDVKANQASGFYFDAPISGGFQMPPSHKPSGLMEYEVPPEDCVFVTEYHGKVPLKYLMALEGTPPPDTMDEDELVEAIVTVGNFSTLLRAKKNPMWMEDRAIVAYQHESVPGEFWGRGVAEKGYNPQKALDAEIRMRIDALALVAAPMVAADKARLPKTDLSVFPGKQWPVVGDPREVLMPFNFGQLNPATFDQASDLERMVKQGTGAMDPGAALSQGARRDTMGGTAMMAASTVKRSKRTMHNIENQLLRPLIQKILWRYMQFRPERYKQDVKFSVRGAMGMMAREFEQSQLLQMYAATPDEAPPKMLILREVFALSSSPNKQRMVDAIDRMLAPPDEETQAKQKMMEELNLRRQIAEVNLLENQALNQGAQASEHAAKGNNIVLEGQLKDDELTHDAMRVQIEATEAQTMQEQTRQTAISNQIKAKSLEIQAAKLSQQERQHQDKMEVARKKATQKPKASS
jgi:hypothetical protein